MSTGVSYNADRVGSFTPKMEDRAELATGEVGFVIAGIKDIFGAPVGDTLTMTKAPCAKPLPGFKQVQPRVFAGCSRFPPTITRVSARHCRNCG